MSKKPIGIFDSGYGGLTVLKKIVEKMPQYDYIYLGDNARAPYGSRTFDTIHQYTLEAVNWFFKNDCALVVLACNTASAKALRTIQQKDLLHYEEHKRVLGVIRPTTEIIASFTKTKHVGVLGTKGTVASGSYPIEIAKFFPDIVVHQQACPMLVPLIENNELASIGTDYFIQKYLDELFAQSNKIDCILLACTHYPILQDRIKSLVPAHVQIIGQGDIVADSLSDYLLRHSDLDQYITKNATLAFYTTDATEEFDEKAAIFFGKQVQSKRITL